MGIPIDPIVGVDITLVGVGSDTAQKLIPYYALGTKVRFNDAVYQYCKAAGTVAAGDLVKITPDAGAYTFVAGTTTLLPSTEPAKVGVALMALTTGQCAWVFVGPGLCQVNIKASCVQNVKLYTHATAGYVDDTATTLINGLSLITTVGGADIALQNCIADTELTTAAA